MGECLTPIPVKLRAATVAEIDAMRAQLPLEPGRSTVARGLIEEVFLLIAEGILQFRSARGNRLLSVSSVSGIPSIPSEFPVIEAGLTKKPLTRIAASEGSGARRREVHGVSRRTVANVAWGTSLIIHSTPLNERAA